MNYVAIDPSLISSGLVVNGKLYNYCRESDAYNKKDLKKWFKLAEEHITYRFVDYRKFKTYSEGEVIKLKDYDKITDMIIKDILDNINTKEETIVKIEGYSFSSSAGPLIDLVTFSTLLRKKLFDKVSENIEILAPSTLKQESCKLTYKPIDIGVKKEKLEWRNNEGIAGGKFDKFHMGKSLIENTTLDHPYVVLLRSLQKEMSEISKVPKPFEDQSDAFLLYLLCKRDGEKTLNNKNNI